MLLPLLKRVSLRPNLHFLKHCPAMHSVPTCLATSKGGIHSEDGFEAGRNMLPAALYWLSKRADGFKLASLNWASPCTHDAGWASKTIASTKTTATTRRVIAMVSYSVLLWGTFESKKQQLLKPQ